MPDITVPQGARFFLQWTADRGADVTNSFDIIDGTKKNCTAPAVIKPKGKVQIHLHVTRDGKPNGFRTDMVAPQSKASSDSKQTIFTSTFLARQQCVLVFTVELSNGTSFTKQVTVTPALDIS